MDIEQPWRVYRNNHHAVWFGRWHDGARYRTKQVPCDVQNERDANRWFSDWWEEFAKCRNVMVALVEAPSTIRSLAKKWEDYVANEPDAHPEARRNAESVMRLHVFPYRIADIPIEDLKLGHCTDWIDTLRGEGKAPYSVRNIVQAVRTFFSDARGKGWIDCENYLNDPFVRKKLRGAKSLAGPDVIVNLSLPQVTRIVSYRGEAVPLLRHAKYVLGVTSGLRAGELAGLSWSRIDLESNPPRVVVDRQLLRGVSKVGKPHFRDPKRGSFRTLPLHPVAVLILKSWREQWEKWVCRRPTDDDPVFPNEAGQYIVADHANLLRRDLGAFDINPLFEGKHLINFHALRKTFLTLLTDAGVSDGDVKALAGHSAAGVTRRHYVAKNIDRFAEAIGRLPLKAA